VSSSECPFCNDGAGEVLWRDALCCVLWPREPAQPALCRVVLWTHVQEMTDLAAAERTRVMTVVFAVEQALRELVAPDKMSCSVTAEMTSWLRVMALTHFKVVLALTGQFTKTQLMQLMQIFQDPLQV